MKSSNASPRRSKKNSQDSLFPDKSNTRNQFLADISRDSHSVDEISLSEAVGSIKLQSRLLELQDDLARRQESYVQRERHYEKRILELEQQVQKLMLTQREWFQENEKLSQVKQTHSEIMKKIDHVHNRTVHVLREQESDLLKAFKSRLYDVQIELDAEKSKKDFGANEWIDRCNALTSELEWSKSVIDRIERANQQLIQDNNRLKSEYAAHEEDRTYLVTQLVTVKKDNTRLRAEFNAIESEKESYRRKYENSQAIKTKENSVLMKELSDTEKERLNNVNIASVYRQLEDLKKQYNQLKKTYSNELQSKSELELILRECVDDVRKELSQQQSSKAKPSTASDSLHRSIFSTTERDKFLEILLSKEKVLTLLYAQAFPSKQHPPLGSMDEGMKDALTRINTSGKLTSPESPHVAFPKVTRNLNLKLQSNKICTRDFLTSSIINFQQRPYTTPKRMI